MNHPLMSPFVSASLIAGSLLVGGVAWAGDHVTLDQLPAAVRATVERETKGGKITSIEKEHEEGVLIYEVEFTQNGKAFELDVALDGKLLERHAD
ncbi:MAG TPA: PepSY domain-containing protein [Polyangiaceae bacterium]|nr:PepSY domain-containing protein [Polyangiaceae bacterium]